MDCRTFWDAVHSEPGLTWHGVSGDEVIIKGPRFIFAITVETIEDGEWVQLRDVLLERRMPVCLTQIARIVGYWSNMRNWNRSKVAEQRDRRQGDYGFTERALEAFVPVPVPELVSVALASKGAEMACKL